MRYLLFIIAIWVGVMIVRHFLRSSAVSHQQKTEPVQAMVRCSHCGVHFPKSEAIVAGDELFCSKEHRDAHRK